MTNSTPQRPPTAGSVSSSDGASSPPPQPRLLSNMDAGSTGGGGDGDTTCSPRSQTPSKLVGGPGVGGANTGPWRPGGGAGGSTGTFAGASSAFRPPQSQGIPITAGAGSRRGGVRRQSSRNSFGGGSMGGGGGVFSSPFSGPGSFLRSAAVFGSQHSSMNSWSVWNPESFDSRFGGLRWRDGVPPSSVSHSLRSWVWVNDPCESDLSGMRKSV